MGEDKCKSIIQRDSEYEEDQDILLEKCWYPQRQSESRPFLIRDASFRSTLPPEPRCSIQKTSYVKRVIEEISPVGVKKTLLLKKFQKEAEEEILEERRPKPPTGDYRTTNDCFYQVEGFEPDDKFYMKHEELYKKYPLYSNAAVQTTKASYQIMQNSSDKPQGVTFITTRSQPFRRCGGFTTPLDKKLDNRIW